MNQINDMTDEEFVPFLHNLGVETYKKSFEWMLNDPDFAGVLRWLYNNLDQNNALSAREECRYLELEKKGQILSQAELKAKLSVIKDEYPNICLPGDQEAIEELKLDISLQKQRLQVLEKQEQVIKDLIKHNESTKENLSVKVLKLSSAQLQCEEDMKIAADNCLKLAQEVDTLLDGVIDSVADTLEIYKSCHDDKEIAKRFITFGPLDSYRQSQALFRSHFDLYTTKYFTKRQDTSDDDLKAALIAAKGMEGRLSDALFAYIESKAELSGEHAKLDFVTNYNEVHSSQVTSCLMEEQSNLELLEQEEYILNQQIHSAVKELVNARTSLAVDVAAKSTLAAREQVQSCLSRLLAVSQLAAGVDRAAYRALRRELTALETFLHFAADLKLYATSQNEAITSRIDSMHAICTEQDACEKELQRTSPLLQSLHTILGGEPSNDALQLVTLYSDLQRSLKELHDEVDEGYVKREVGLVAFKQSAQPLKEYIYDGCTKQPNCWDRSLASLTHTLKQEMNKIDKQVLGATNMFASVKNGDKKNLRKLWQWFLTDTNKLMAVIKGA